MAPIKFEEQIKDKLEKRTVTPSTDAWSKLSQQLDTENNRSKKAPFWWIGIAASVAALIMISVGYFSKDSEAEIDEIIVKDVIEESVETKNENVLINNQDSEKQQVARNNISENENNQKTNSKSIHQPKSSKLVVKKQQQQLVQNSTLKKEKTFAKVKTTTIPEIEIEKLMKQESVVAAVDVEFNSVTDELKAIKAKKEVTDQHVDSLLKVASKELFVDKVLKKNSDVVNADALLQDVEDDMGQSFRTRIYKTLKGGYKEVKKAVAQRHDN